MTTIKCKVLNSLGGAAAVVLLVACSSSDVQEASSSSVSVASSQMAVASSQAVIISSSQNQALSSSAITHSSQASLPSGPPVSVGPANAPNQSPAFPQQTRAPEIKTSKALNVQTVATGLASPWGIAFLPDGRVLVTEKSGTLRIVTQEGVKGASIAGVPSVNSQGQAGLLDVIISPTFSEDRWVYFSYSESRSDGTGTNVARAKLSGDETKLTDVQIIFKQTPSWQSTLHYGSRLVWDTAGHLYITLGERSVPDARVFAQDVTTYLGKLVRIMPDGGIPAGNPYADGIMGKPGIWSYGHRNIQGAAIHPDTGEIWTIEHGPRGGDELNQPEPGKNYGWPIITYGEDYSGLPIGDGITEKDGMEQPVYYWDPVIAPSDMIFYTGSAFPEWKGDIFIGALKGYIVRVKLNNQLVVGEERLSVGSGRVRDIVQADDGNIWWITDEGALRRTNQ